LEEGVKSSVFQMIKTTNSKVKVLNEWHTDVDEDLAIIKNNINWLKKIVPITTIFSGLINIIYNVVKGG